MITDTQRKLITEELLDECWHTKKEPRTMAGYKCEKCGDILEWRKRDDDGNRTFTTWEDFGAVVEKLLTTETDAFDLSEFFEGKYHNENDTAPIYEVWLLNPERFCVLVAEAIKEGVIK